MVYQQPRVRAKSNIFFVGVLSPQNRGFWVYAPASFYRLRLDQLPEDFPVNPYFLDGLLLGVPLARVPEGEGVVVHHRGWTILSFWDCSGSNNLFFAPTDVTSNFVMRGTHSFADAVAKAKAAFPVIWTRFPFEVREKPL